MILWYIWYMALWYFIQWKEGETIHNISGRDIAIMCLGGKKKRGEKPSKSPQNSNFTGQKKLFFFLIFVCFLGYEKIRKDNWSLYDQDVEDIPNVKFPYSDNWGQWLKLKHMQTRCTQFWQHPVAECRSILGCPPFGILRVRQLCEEVMICLIKSNPV